MHIWMHQFKTKCDCVPSSLCVSLGHMLKRSHVFH